MQVETMGWSLVALKVEPKGIRKGGQVVWTEPPPFFCGRDELRFQASQLTVKNPASLEGVVRERFSRWKWWRGGWLLLGKDLGGLAFQ